MSGGTVGRLWTSSVAIGRSARGSTSRCSARPAAMRWASEQPNQVFLHAPRRPDADHGEGRGGGLSDEAARLSSRRHRPIPKGSRWRSPTSTSTLAAAIRGEARGALPLAEDGLRSMAAVHACVASAKGQWRLGRWPARRCCVRRPERGASAPFDHPAREQPGFRVAVGLLDRRHHEVDGGGGPPPPPMISATGCRIVVRSMFCQRAMSMSFSPMMPISSGQRMPASAMADSAPIEQHVSRRRNTPSAGRSIRRRVISTRPASKRIGPRVAEADRDLGMFGQLSQKPPARGSCGRGRGFRSAEEGDIAVAARDQRLGGHAPAGDVVDAHHMQHAGWWCSARRNARPACRRRERLPRKLGGRVEEATITPSTEYWRSILSELAGSVSWLRLTSSGRRPPILQAAGEKVEHLEKQRVVEVVRHQPDQLGGARW